jgi:TolB protein
MRLLVVLAALAAITVLLLPTSSATSAAAPRPGELAFVRGEGSATEIYVVRADGSRLRRLTKNGFSDFAPIWSPDGRRILFVSNRDGDDELYVMDANGANVRQLTRNRRQDLTPQWSPDGTLIAFASDRNRPGQPEIWVMRADGGGARRLVATVDHPTWQDLQYSPAWSPDGRRLIFSMTAADSNPELYGVAVDGSGLTRLTRTAGGSEVHGDDTMPDWSADGKAIVFVSNRERRSSDLWTMRPDGSGQRPLMRRPRTDDWNPRLSSDGRTLAFTEHVIGTGARSVWLARRDGSGLRRLIDGAEPDWRPSPMVAASTFARRISEHELSRRAGSLRTGDDS